MATERVIRMLLLLLLHCLYVSAAWKYSDPEKYPNVPYYGPQPNPPYMMDNTHNYYGVAPDNGKQNGPVWAYSGSYEQYLSNLYAGKVMRGGFGNNTSPTLTDLDSTRQADRQDGSYYWLTTLAPLGSQPRAGPGYKFYRNVLDYGADNSGHSDTAEAINAAVAEGNRCGQQCGNTFSLGAIVYFPSGTYKICSPIIQLSYTQFIGDPHNPPTILGCHKFEGIGLIDTDPYIPNSKGKNWYNDQNQFFRQIRNFVFDMTQMPEATDDHDQPLVPTGIHWQVAQATSLQNLVFNMPEATNNRNTTAVGIFTENGGGGFVSNLTFNGGNIGWRAGSQQYTARSLTFNNCLTAVQMSWDWGWVWQRIEVFGGAIAFNISGVGGDNGQGIGSISIVDSNITNVPVGILTNNNPTSPHIVLDNVQINGVDRAVQVDNGATLLTASGTVGLWTTGKVYKGGNGSEVTGSVDVPAKGSRLLSGGKLYIRDRPQYENYSPSQFSIATKDGGCKNDGTGDQTECLNAFLQKAVASQLIAYFPAGVYQVGSTILIPTGSRVVGSSWSQIQGTGYYFSDMANPRVVVRVGNPGDIGIMEITDMLFTVSGNTAGAVIIEWNVAAVFQGAAAMWDSHVRVGGAMGTDLDISHCPKRSFSDQCIAASLMMRVTQQSSGYFENVWIWTADHDNDVSVYDSPDKLSSQISIYCARGLLIESQGPSWFYGSSSEHSIMYNYLLSGAKDVYLGHIQTETPYFQPEPIAPQPFNIAASFPGDPDFSSCNGDAACASAWGMVIADSRSVTIHGAGLYSFFRNYDEDCLQMNDCQQRILRVTGSTGVVIMNLFTVATSDIAMGIDGTVLLKNDNQRGFTTEVSIWLPLDGADNINTIFVGTEIWTSNILTCSDPLCLLVFPTSPLLAPATISPSPYTTSFQYGSPSTVTSMGVVTVTFVVTTTTIVLTVPPITITGMPFSNYNISSGQSTIDVSQSVSISPLTIQLPDGSGHTTSRVVQLPPWPLIDGGPTAPSTIIPVPSRANPSGSSTLYTGITSSVTVTTSTVTHISFPAATTPTILYCPIDDDIVFETPSTTVYPECTNSTTLNISFDCPTVKVVTFLAPTTGVVSVDCSLVTLFTTTAYTAIAPTTSTSALTLPTWTTWPPGVIYPLTEKVDNPERTNDGTKQRCTLWFFFLCIHLPSLDIGGWFWHYPPGVYPPGPPPKIQWPPRFTQKGTLPPWPPITIGFDGKLTYPDEPTESCTTTQTASICMTTTTFSVTSSGSFVSTTATATESTCETITGCSVSHSSTAVETDTITTCTISPTSAAGLLTESSDATGDISSSDSRAGNDCEEVPAVIYPANPMDAQGIESIETELVNHEHRRITSTDLGYTAYIWVKSLPKDTRDRLELLPAVELIYDYRDWNAKNTPQEDTMILYPKSKYTTVPAIYGTRDFPGHNSLYGEPPSNGTSAGPPVADKTQNWEPGATSAIADGYWNDALISLPPNQPWKVTERGGKMKPNYFIYYYDNSAGSGVTVYAIGDTHVNSEHPEWKGRAPPRPLNRQCDYGNQGGDTSREKLHGTSVAAVISGNLLGVCKGCDVVYSSYLPPQSDKSYPRDWYLEDLLSAWDDMHRDGRTPSGSIINMSWGSKSYYWTPAFIKRLYDILKRMDRAGVTIVVAAGNSGTTDNLDIPGGKRKAIDTYPQLFAQQGNPYNTVYQDPDDPDDLGYLPNMIVVGAADQFGGEWPSSQTASFVTTYASGYNVYGVNSIDGYDAKWGTSFAAPQVAALAAYFKKLPSKWESQLNEPNTNGPKAVKAMIVALQRNIKTKLQKFSPKVPLVWNGMDVGLNCLVDNTRELDTDGVCPDLPEKITDYRPPASCANAALAAGPPMMAVDNITLFERQSDGFCTLAPDAGGGTQITFTSGASAGPTCGNTNGCGGTVCSGYWCAPTPTGYPPNHQDPRDPNSSGYVAPTTTAGPIITTSATIITVKTTVTTTTITTAWFPLTSESPSSFSTALPSGTPHVECELFPVEELHEYLALIETDDWVTDGGENLKSEVSDCGAVRDWRAWRTIVTGEFSWVITHQFTFSLPLSVNAGCVESAIENAGGPKKVGCNIFRLE